MILGPGLSNDSIYLEVGVVRTMLGTVNPQGMTGLNETSGSVFIPALVWLQGLCPALNLMRELLCLHWPRRCFLGLRLMKNKGMRNKGWFPFHRFFKARGGWG